MYLVGAASFSVWYYSGDAEEREESLGIPNTELLAGMAITAVVALTIEYLARLAYIIVWSKYIPNASGLLVAVWWPQLMILTMVMFVNLLGHVSVYWKKYRKVKDRDNRSDGNSSTCRDIIWEIHSSKLHAIIAIASIVFALVYTVLPAIVLVFVYPAQMIAILAFLSSFLFATTVFSAILFKYLMQLFNRDMDNEGIHTCTHKIASFLKKMRTHKSETFFLTYFLFSLITTYIHAIIVAILYSLIIGRGSVITTGPTFFISLLLPALLSGVSWFAKKYWLNNDSDN